MTYKRGSDAELLLENIIKTENLTIEDTEELKDLLRVISNAVSSSAFNSNSSIKIWLNEAFLALEDAALEEKDITSNPTTVNDLQSTNNFAAHN